MTRDDRSVKFIIELDQKELAVRLLEAAGQMKRPPGKSVQECLDDAPPEIRDQIFRMSQAAMIWFGECCDKMERPS
jgi:hypothetical protein